MHIEKIAEVCHEANRAYCESIGDYSQVPWLNAPEWQRASAINGVRFHLEHPGRTPRESHENWLREKEVDGWIYGPVKDVEKKQHPCMMPYHQLPPAQRAKDYIFTAIVRTLADTLKQREPELEPVSPMARE